MVVQEPIPRVVITALLAVRADGSTNMLDREGVIYMVDQLQVGGEWAKAVMWLYDNGPRYVEALEAMGEARKKNV